MINICQNLPQEPNKKIVGWLQLADEEVENMGIGNQDSRLPVFTWYICLTHM
jgi:hypothetical protein